MSDLDKALNIASECGEDFLRDDGPITQGDALTVLAAEVRVITDRYNSCKAEFAAAQTKIEAQSKRILWMAGDALAIHDRAEKAESDLAEANQTIEKLRWKLTDAIDVGQADLAAAKAELADDYGKAKMFFAEAEQLRRNVGELEAALSQARAECAKIGPLVEAINTTIVYTNVEREPGKRLTLIRETLQKALRDGDFDRASLPAPAKKGERC